MSNIKMRLAETTDLDFVHEILNSPTMKSVGFRPVSRQTLNATINEGFIFDLNAGSGFVIFYDESEHSPVGVWKINSNLAHQYSVISGGLKPDKIAKGLGRYCVEQVVEFVFRSYPVERIEVNILTSNKVSLNTAIKVGFELEGIKRKAWFCDGQLQDQAVLGLTRLSLQKTTTLPSEKLFAVIENKGNA